MTTQLELGLASGTEAVRIPAGGLADPGRKDYVIECRKRWSGDCLRDALANRTTWVEHSETIKSVVRMWMADMMVRDLSGRARNPQGSLDAWLWLCSRSHPWMVDFEENFQRFFLRRGLRQWCRLLMRRPASPATVF